MVQVSVCACAGNKWRRRSLLDINYKSRPHKHTNLVVPNSGDAHLTEHFNRTTNGRRNPHMASADVSSCVCVCALTQNDFQMPQSTGRVLFAVLQLADGLLQIDGGAFVEHGDDVARR